MRSGLLTLSPELPGKGDEILYAESFGAKVENGIRYETGILLICPSFLFRPGGNEGFQRVPESFASLVEPCLDHSLEEIFIAAQVPAGIPFQTYYGRLDFRGRVERPFSYGEDML